MQTNEDFTVDFGKYKGCSFSEIVKRDNSYAYWLYQNCDKYKNSTPHYLVMRKLLGFLNDN